MEEKLIEAVRLRRILYDTSHEDYLKTKLKAEKWKEVALETDIRTGTEAKAMWEKLRHSLRDALRRQQKCLKSGAASESVKQWKFQKQMAFLQLYMANKTREGNPKDDIEDSETPWQNCDMDSLTDVVECEQSLTEQSLTMQQGISDRTESKALLEIGNATQAPTSGRKMKKDAATSVKRNMDQQEGRRKLTTHDRKGMLARTRASNDPLYHFFLSMYGVTKNMPPPFQFAVRNDIFRVVTETEGTLLNFPAGTPSLNEVHRPTVQEFYNNQASRLYTDSSMTSNSSHSDFDSPLPNPTG